MIRKILPVVGLVVVALMGMAVAGVRPALGQEEKVTICHAAGLAGTTHYITLTISRNAVFGPGGHFNEDGTPQAGHEQDYMGACTTDTTTTDTTDTTTTTTTIDERGVATAGAICIRALGEYRVVGTIDGVPATVEPDTIPGNKNGSTLVRVTLGTDSQLVIVNTAGDCVQSDEPPGTTTTTTTTTGTTTGGDTTTGTTDTTGTTTTVETTTDTTTGDTTTTPTGSDVPGVIPPKNNKPPKNGSPTSNNGTPNKKNKIPPLCPVGKPANSPNQPCAVQGNG